MATQLIDVTGTDFWAPEWWDVSWNNDRWETVNYDNGMRAFPKKIEMDYDYNYLPSFWDPFGSAEVFEIRVGLYSKDGPIHSNPCTSLHLTSSAPVQINGGSTEFTYEKTDDLIIARPNSTLLITDINEINILLVGAFYWYECGQSYVSSIKMLIAGGEDPTFWQMLARTEETA